MKRKDFIKDAIKIIIEALIAWGVIQIFFLPAFVPSSSMVPTINKGSFLLGCRASYWREAPAHGDMVIFYSEDQGRYLVKRIVACPNDSLTIKDNCVYLNDVLLEENYTVGETKATYEPVTYVLGDDEYFVMGDNREHSSDSRNFGVITKKSIKAKVLLIIPRTFFVKVMYL